MSIPPWVRRAGWARERSSAVVTAAKPRWTPILRRRHAGARGLQQPFGSGNDFHHPRHDHIFLCITPVCRSPEYVEGTPPGGTRKWTSLRIASCRLGWLRSRSERLREETLGTMTMNCLPIQWRRTLILSAAVALAACSSSSTTNDARLPAEAGARLRPAQAGPAPTLMLPRPVLGVLQTVAPAARPPVVVD